MEDSFETGHLFRSCALVAGELCRFREKEEGEDGREQDLFAPENGELVVRRSWVRPRPFADTPGIIAVL